MAYLLVAYTSVFGLLGAYWLWLRRRRERGAAFARPSGRRG